MVIIVKSLNITPEEEVNTRIAPLLEQGYHIVSATTSLATHGNIESTRDMPGMGLFLDIAKHVYYVTTVVLAKP